MKHRHAELMMEYARDAMETDKPWERWEFKFRDGGVWRCVTVNPSWGTDREYRRKPMTININGFEVPKPVKKPLEDGTEYYMPTFTGNLFYMITYWVNSPYDHSNLEKGLVHLTKEAAIKHAEALLSFTRIEK